MTRELTTRTLLSLIERVCRKAMITLVFDHDWDSGELVLWGHFYLGKDFWLSKIEVSDEGDTIEIEVSSTIVGPQPTMGRGKSRVNKRISGLSGRL